MMIPFLQQTVNELYAKYGDKLSNYCVVLPNKRAAVYFRNYLSQCIEKPVFMPSLVAINELFLQHSNYVLADPLLLNLKLFQQYRQLSGTEELFDDFYFWGEMLLNDFDDVDKYMVEAKPLFTTLTATHEIEQQFQYLTPEQIASIKQFWDAFDAQNPSEYEQRFINLWQVMLDLYTRFRAQLHDEGAVYEGMAYRFVADNVRNIDFVYDKYVFIGFNALNKCERRVLQYLNSVGKAEFYWDYDNLYLDMSDEVDEQSRHEAGLFIRENCFNPRLNNLPITNKHWNFDGLRDAKNIDIVAFPNAIAQTRWLSDELKKIPAGKEGTAAVVLADEKLLVPVLHALPPNIPSVNVSMGYPFATTDVYTLLAYCIDMQQSVTNGVFYFKTVLQVLNHPFVRAIAGDDSTEHIARLQKVRYHYVSGESFQTNDLFKILFRIPPLDLYVDYYQDILLFLANHLRQQTETTENNILLEAILMSYKTLQRLQSVLTNEPLVQRTATFNHLIRKELRDLSIPIVGEPVVGLQIMGALETRLLDFDTIFVLSVNEGIFPKGRPIASFIPHSLRQGFEIQTLKHQDAIYSYYFYRVLQKASNVKLLYINQQTDGSKGEMSRFLAQMLYLYPMPNWEMQYRAVGYNISIPVVHAIEVPKTTEMLTQMRKMRYSAKSLNSFLTCSLQFYFQYIEGMKEADEYRELPDERDFGLLFHKAVEVLYKPWLNKAVSAKDFEHLSQAAIIEEAVTAAFTEEFKIKAIEVRSGYNAILFNILQKYLQQLLSTDKLYEPLTIMGLEKGVEYRLAVDTDKISLMGNIDRVDLFDGTLRVVDYKTGNPGSNDKKLKFASLDSLFDTSTENRSNEAFQTLYYCFLLSKSALGSYASITPALYFINKLGGKLDYHLRQEKETLTNAVPLLADFEAGLQATLRDMLHPELPFVQTEVTDRCSYCAYKDICRRV